jgi:histidyl-tRNA synthetase
MQPARGTRDFLDVSFALLEHIRTTLMEITGLYGFSPVETPVFEHTSVFLKTLGDTTDMVGKEMYTFTDKGGESLTLRPEGTAALVRAILSNSLTQSLPQKRSYFGPMFRYERPQKGRYRQFYQFGVEHLGAAAAHMDAEVIAMALQALSTLGIDDFTLHINTLGDRESRLAFRAALVAYFGRYVHDLSAESQERLHINPLRILDSKAPQDIALCHEAPLREDYLNAASRTFFEDVRKNLEALGIDYYLDPQLVRGIDYYCHTVFEFTSGALGAQNAFGGGGRYDGLVELMGGPAIPGVGWAMGVDRLMLMLEKAFTPPNPHKVAVIPVGDDTLQACFVLTQQLRHHHIPVELITHGNMGKKFKQADKLGCTRAVVMGSEEQAQGVVKVRSLTNHDRGEEAIAIANLATYLKP